MTTGTAATAVTEHTVLGYAGGLSRKRALLELGQASLAHESGNDTSA